MKASRSRSLLVLSTVFVVLGLLYFDLTQNAVALARIALISTKTNPAAQHGSLIPKNIWQIFLRPPNSNNSFQIGPSKISDAASWLARNPDYSYHLVGDQGASRILHQHKLSNKKLREIYHGLPNTGMKSDLLRYVILANEGGVYADTDVEAIRPIDTWIPEQYSESAKVVVGIEFDRLDGPNWAQVHEELQFCQWTIAAAPNNPLLLRMITSVVTRLDKHAKDHDSTVGEVEFSDSDVINLTGPSAWTDVVFEQLRIYQPSLTSVRDLTGLTEPTLIGDILILPIDGFGMGQPHSNSTNDGSIPDDALVQHKFRGSWRTSNDKS
ncbi:hypothetical protein J3459_016793 [Metarhizium acridum]|nr:hypothetical protein J3459_016793 [Metarhizium acridum]